MQLKVQSIWVSSSAHIYTHSLHVCRAKCSAWGSLMAWRCNRIWAWYFMACLPYPDLICWRFLRLLFILIFLLFFLFFFCVSQPESLAGSWMWMGFRLADSFSFHLSRCSWCCRWYPHSWPIQHSPGILASWHPVTVPTCDLSPCRIVYAGGLIAICYSWHSQPYFKSWKGP